MKILSQFCFSFYLQFSYTIQEIVSVNIIIKCYTIGNEYMELQQMN